MDFQDGIFLYTFREQLEIMNGKGTISNAIEG